MGFGRVCPKVRKARDYYDYHIAKAISKVNINALWELKFSGKTDTILEKWFLGTLCMNSTIISILMNVLECLINKTSRGMMV